MAEHPETSSAQNFIQDATAENFNELVVDNSNKGPVLVNYWSKKVGPCIRQYPVLERVVNEMEGRFLLVNLNTDDHRQLAKDFGVTSLPTLKLFQKGEVIETRHGYQDEADLRRLMNKYLPRLSDKALSQALKTFQQGDIENALVMLAEAAIEDPQNIRLPLTMARLLVIDGQIDEAEQLLANMPVEIRDDEQAKLLRSHIGFIKVVNAAPDKEELEQHIATDSADCEARYQLGAHYVLGEDYEAALALFYEVTQIDRDYDNGIASDGLLIVFALLGDEHKLVKNYREKMQRNLH